MRIFPGPLISFAASATASASSRWMLLLTLISRSVARGSIVSYGLLSLPSISHKRCSIYNVDFLTFLRMLRNNVFDIVWRVWPKNSTQAGSPFLTNYGESYGISSICKFGWFLSMSNKIYDWCRLICVSVQEIPCRIWVIPLWRVDALEEKLFWQRQMKAERVAFCILNFSRIICM